MEDPWDLSPEDIEYVLNLPYHLAQAEKSSELCQQLIEFDFVEYKISASGSLPLIEDYQFALEPDIQLGEKTKKSLQLIQDSLRLSENILLDDQDGSQLVEQLLGRLLRFETPEIQTLLDQVKQWHGAPWLRPLTSSLTPPGGPLLRTLTGHTDWVRDVAITPDGKFAVSCSDDRTLSLWDLQTGIELATLVGHDDWVMTVAITPDGKWVVSGSGDRTLKIWDLDTGNVVRTLYGHTRLIRAVAITPDGQYIVSASQDQTLKIWDFHQGIPLRILTGHTAPILAVAITPNGQQIVSAAEDGILKVWDFNQGTELHMLKGHTKQIQDIVITPDGEQIVSVSRDRTLRVWDLY
jgi:WD40 repeat protein